MATDLTHLPPQMRDALLAAGQQAAEQFERGEVDLRPVDSLSPEMALSLLRWQRRRVEEQTRREVDRAREAGMSWRRIGEALGVSAQAARQRFHTAA